METPALLGIIAVIAVLLVGGLLSWMALRYRSLARRVGSFDCAMSPLGSDSWTSGVAIFGDKYVSWYRSVGLRRKPDQSFSRHRLTLVDHHQQDTEAGTIVVHITCNGTEVLWGLAQDSLSGLVSWMDAAPPAEEPTRI